MTDDNTTEIDIDGYSISYDFPFYQTEILEGARQTVYDRADTHGEPEESFATIADKWTAHIRALLRSDGIDPEGFSLDPDAVANMMIDLKTSRNAEGHYTEDNWVDIAGYAECGARIETEETE